MACFTAVRAASPPFISLHAFRVLGGKCITSGRGRTSGGVTRLLVLATGTQDEGAAFAGVISGHHSRERKGSSNKEQLNATVNSGSMEEEQAVVAGAGATNTSQTQVSRDRGLCTLSIWVLYFSLPYSHGGRKGSLNHSPWTVCTKESVFVF